MRKNPRQKEAKALGHALLDEMIQPNHRISKERVRYLINAGADLNVMNDSGNTALILAMWGDCLETVQLLLASGANPNFINYQHENDSVLHQAVWGGHLGILKEVLKHDVFLDVKNSQYNTPLMVAAWQGRLDQVKVLVEKGADIHLRDIEDKTAAMMAEEAGYTDIADYLHMTPARRLDTAHKKFQEEKKRICAKVAQGTTHKIKRPKRAVFKRKL